MTEPDPSPPTVEDMQAAYVRPSRKPGRPAVEGGRQSVTLRLRGPLLAYARAEADRRGWPLAHFLDMTIASHVLRGPQQQQPPETCEIARELLDAELLHPRLFRKPTEDEMQATEAQVLTPRERKAAIAKRAAAKKSESH